MYKKIIYSFLIVCIFLNITSCTNKNNANSNTDSKDEKYILESISISENTPWNEKINLSTEEKKLLETVREEINNDINSYHSGNINLFLNKVTSGMSVSYSTGNTFFVEEHLDKYVSDKTEFEIIDIQPIDNENAKILLNIKYPDIRLSLYKSIKNNTVQKNDNITLQIIKDNFEKNPIYKEGAYILNYNKSENNNAGIYISKNNIQKALTGGLISRGVSKINSDEDKCKKVNEYLNNCLALLQKDDLTDYYANVSSWKTDTEKKEILENTAFKTIRNYFVTNTNIEVIEGNTSFKSIVSYPNFNKILLPLLKEKKNTNEIINEINKNINDGNIEMIEDTLEGDIYIDGNTNGILDDYIWLFSNLGIDSIDMIMSDFEEVYNFNISNKIKGLN